MRSIAISLLYSGKIHFRLLRHLLLFAGMNFLFSWVVYSQDQNDLSFMVAARGVLVNSVFFFGYAYLTAYALVPWLIPRRKYIPFAVLFIVSGLTLSWAKFAFSGTIFYNSLADQFSTDQGKVSLPEVLMNAKDMTFIVALFLIAKYTRDNYILRNRINELQQHQLQSEIRLLRNQLDPHVVFNNLNNIYCLSLNKDGSVGIYLRRLYTVLEYYFRVGTMQRVPLAKELEAVTAYIRLEEIRYGDRLKTSFSVEGDFTGKKIYPFVLFSYVENCFTHGCVSESGNAWIKIFIKAARERIIFHASNSKPGDAGNQEVQDTSTVIGRKKAALELLYPGRHSIHIENRDDEYRVDLMFRT